MAAILEEVQRSAAGRNLRFDAPVRQKKGGHLAVLSGTGPKGAIRFEGKGETPDEALADLLAQAPVPTSFTVERHCPTCTCEG